MLHLIEKELRLHLLSQRFLILAVFAALGIGLCLYDGYITYVARLVDYRAAQTMTDRELMEISENGNNPDFSAEGYASHKPPVVLTIFTRAIDPVLGRTIRTGWTQMGTRAKSSPKAVDPDTASFLPLDLGLFVEVVLSLFVLLLTYDAVCGEKQEGTLRLLSSYSVPRATVLLAKVIGAMAAAAAIFWIPFLLGVGVLVLMPEIAFTNAELIRLGFLGISITTTLSLFVFAGLLGSAASRHPSTSFVLLLAYWAFAVIVLPKVSFVAADLLLPAPSVQELRAGREAVHNNFVNRRRKRWVEWEEAYVAKHGEDWRDSPEHREQSTLYNQQEQKDYMDLANAGYQKLDQEYENRYNARADLAQTLAAFSPAFLLRESLAKLCGTGLDRHRRFEQRFVEYREEWGVWIREDSWKGEFSNAWREKYGEHEWDTSDMPLFTYRDAWPTSELQDILVNVGLMGGWCLLFFAGAFVSMLRYDPR